MRQVTIFDQEYTSPLVLCEDVSKIVRYYQANSANEVAGHIESGYNRIMVKIPAGTGKTLISKLIAISVRFRVVLGLSSGDKLRVLYIANKHRLNRQAIEQYAENEVLSVLFSRHSLT
jgi:type I site-specific restriction endonuclease